jgi:hypothetical protein
VCLSWAQPVRGCLRTCCLCLLIRQGHPRYGKFQSRSYLCYFTQAKNKSYFTQIEDTMVNCYTSKISLPWMRKNIPRHVGINTSRHVIYTRLKPACVNFLSFNLIIIQTNKNRTTKSPKNTSLPSISRPPPPSSKIDNCVAGGKSFMMLSQHIGGVAQSFPKKPNLIQKTISGSTSIARCCRSRNR